MFLQPYSLNQEICVAKLDLKIKNHRMFQEYFIKSFAVTVKKYIQEKLEAN